MRRFSIGLRRLPSHENTAGRAASATAPRTWRRRPGPICRRSDQGVGRVVMASSAPMRPMAQAVTTSTVPWAPASPPPLLPGETLWRGVPSYAFGTNETQEWDSAFTFEPLPALQQAVKAAHFTLLRTWVFEHSLIDGDAVTDSVQLGRVQVLAAAVWMRLLLPLLLVPPRPSPLLPLLLLQPSRSLLLPRLADPLRILLSPRLRPGPPIECLPERA